MGNRNEQLAARRAAEVTGYKLHTDKPDIGLQIYVRTDSIVAKCFRGKAGKPAWHYRFRNEQEMADYITKEIAARERTIEFKAARKAEQNKPVSVAVGDVFEASWGYDQTNIDYYQVTRVISPKTVEVREISSLRWETEYLQGRSVPALDQFIGRPMNKRVKPAGDGGAAIRINSFCDAYKMTPVIDGTPIYGSSMWTAYA